MKALAIRDFFSNLFRSRKLEALVVNHELQILELKRAHERELARLNRALAKQEKDSEALLAETRKERDYFRGKCDRFELLLLTPKPTTPIVPRRQGTPTVVGRKSWMQVQLDDLAKQDEELKKRQTVEGAPAEVAGTQAEQSA